MQNIKSLSKHKQSLKDKILRTAMKSFKENGIRAVKMDDIAKKLSISKRTLYEIYANKEELLLEGVKMHNEDVDEILSGLLQTNPNVMDIILMFYKIQTENIRNTNPLFYEELHRYPGILAFMKKTHDSSNVKAQAFFKKGINDGYFREDINYDIISMLADVQINYIMANKFYKKYSLLEIFNSIVLVTVRGFSTQKGLQVLENYISKNKI